jgi:hypothetical protein
MSLVPCTACQRHVRVNDAICPFCAAAQPARAARLREPLPVGLKRAALFALGASLGAAPACGGENEDTTDTNQPQQTGTVTGSGGTDSPQPVYGAPVGPEDPSNTGGGGSGNGGPGSIDPDPSGNGGIPAVQPLYGAIPAPIE